MLGNPMSFKSHAPGCQSIRISSGLWDFHQHSEGRLQWLESWAIVPGCREVVVPHQPRKQQRYDGETISKRCTDDLRSAARILGRFRVKGAGGRTQQASLRQSSSGTIEPTRVSLRGSCTCCSFGPSKLRIKTCGCISAKGGGW